MKKGNVVCIGMAVLDILLAYVDSAILERDLSRIEAISYMPGGDALNESVVLARLGQNCKLMASVGEDLWGGYIRDYLTQAGVDTSSITTNPNYPTSSSVVLVKKNGDRNFISAEGTNDHYMPECIDWKAIEKADVVSIGSFLFNKELDAALVNILSTAQKAGAITTGDMIYTEGVTFEDAKSYLPYFDYIFPNYDEAVGLTGGLTDLEEIGEAILGYGVKTAVVKIGKRGCYVHSKEESFIVPTYKNAVPVDTTGAGDNFAAGFITGLVNGLSLRETAALANGVASVSVTYVGATGIKNYAEVEEMMAGGILVVD